MILDGPTEGPKPFEDIYGDTSSSSDEEEEKTSTLMQRAFGKKKVWL